MREVAVAGDMPPAYARKGTRMHPRVEKLPKPDPDYRRFLSVLQRERPDRVPLIELAVDPEVVDTLLDEPPITGGDQRQAQHETTRRMVRAHHRLGYDVMKISAPIPWNVERLTTHDPSTLSDGARDWLDQHKGPIGSIDDLERFPWPAPSDVNFAPVDTAIETLPDGMRLIGFSGGVLEFAMDLIGMTELMIATRRTPELVAAVIERVGQTTYGVFEAYCQIDAVCAIWLGDDLGHKHGLLIAPNVLKEHVLPWYRRFADLAHEHGRPFLLHTCGNTAEIMPALVEETGIDAKHSFEDGIEPVEAFFDAWHDQVAVLGGVDVHLLSVGEEDAIRERTLAILEHAAPHGGYAAGSGNSIPNYVSPEHYLTMIETVAAYNGRL